VTSLSGNFQVLARSQKTAVVSQRTQNNLVVTQAVFNLSGIILGSLTFYFPH